jgi:GT2 family glycosyltransferase
MDLSIIIVNWNSAQYLRKCLATVYGNTENLEFEVIVVDNASYDGCAEMLATDFPQVQFVQSEANTGFASANNLGFERSTGRYLLFLNPDTEVTGRAVSALLAVLETLSDAGVAGARLLNSDGSVQTSCIQRFPSILNQAIDTDLLRNAFPKWRIWGTWPLLEKQPGPVAVEVISGACMMVSRAAFERVGRMTPDYFMYSEDVDLCFKLQEAGLKNYYCDDAIVVHHGGGSTASSQQSHFSAVVMRDSISKLFSLRRGRIHAVAYRVSVLLSSVVRCGMLVCLLLPSLGRSARLRGALSRWLAVVRWAAGNRSGEAGEPARNSCVQPGL